MLMEAFNGRSVELSMCDDGYISAYATNEARLSMKRGFTFILLDQQLSLYLPYVNKFISRSIDYDKTCSTTEEVLILATK